MAPQGPIKAPLAPEPSGAGEALLEGCPVVAVLLRRILRRYADQRYETIHRTAADALLERKKAINHTARYRIAQHPLTPA